MYHCAKSEPNWSRNSTVIGIDACVHPPLIKSVTVLDLVHFILQYIYKSVNKFYLEFTDSYLTHIYTLIH